MIVNAYAKINLTLDITGRREDGYHTLSTIMQSVDVHDVIELERTEAALKLTTSVPYIPTDKRNTVFNAAEMFLTRINASCGARIHVQKNIPSRAGMGGGSADAAAVLLALNKLHNEPLSTGELLEMAEKIGADVPFCVLGGTYLCEGIGEVLTKAPDMPDCVLLIAKPEFGMKTPRAFSIIDEYPLEVERHTPEMLRALESGDIRAVASGLSNRFDDVMKMRVVRSAKRAMLNSGALGACMTGSGSAVFGIFEEAASAKQCGDYIKAQNLGKVFLSRPVRSGVSFESE